MGRGKAVGLILVNDGMINYKSYECMIDQSSLVLDSPYLAVAWEPAFWQLSDVFGCDYSLHFHLTFVRKI